MIEQIHDVDKATLAPFDAIIDVRSPSEYAADHLPGAINLPVLSDAERAEVGTVYKQESRFKARRIGAAYVARNVSTHIETALADQPNTFHPLIYCWRGGMRSNAMATIFAQIGWRTGVLRGGYKTWRRSVVANLRDSAEPVSIVLLDGQTGTAKSDILRRAKTHGVQIIDLEALAHHRGSVFGAHSDKPQPSQKLFESHVWHCLQRLDHTKPILVEAESNRIGRCEVPARLWQAMLVAPRINVTATPVARADYLIHAYADLIADKNELLSKLDRLRPFHAKERIEEWATMVATGQHDALARALMIDHYDPLYSRTRKHRNDAPGLSISLPSLTPASIDEAAQKIAETLKTRSLRKGFAPAGTDALDQRNPTPRTGAPDERTQS